ncbi:MAG: quinolinate synthase NadA [Campylobacter sp.]|nr:quinolinate synthase NadA [Campylobacter sp.]
MTDNLLEQEAQRLYKSLGQITRPDGQKYSLAYCKKLAPLTSQINELKKQKNALILTHYYCAPEIIFGVSDEIGDSYGLSKKAAQASQDILIFCGVSFMAQTAKLVNPSKKVFLPPTYAGCSLAQSITPKEVEDLRKKYPLAQFICYINSTAEVKALCDICVTSANVFDIVAASPSKQIVFLPDIFMAQNIEAFLKAKGIDKEIIAAGGTCCVHDKYTLKDIEVIKQKYPQAKIICHPECRKEVCQASDFCGSTSAMLKYVNESSAAIFAVLSERGIIAVLEQQNPTKTFLPTGRTCAQMKLNKLEDILEILKDDTSVPEVKVDDIIVQQALKSINAMFKGAKK